MSTQQDSSLALSGVGQPGRAERSTWVLSELLIGYGLIMAVIWTPRPLQRWLYLSAVLWFAVSFVLSFPGWKAMGCSVSGFWRSLWVVGIAVVLAGSGLVIASQMHTLHHPSGIEQWVLAFGGYAVWSFLQQFLLQGYFLLRIARLLSNGLWDAVTAAMIFALAHLPNPILTGATLLWGTAACLIFLRFRNVYTLAMAHAIFGICIAITIPGPVIHNMRVGLGYLTYHAPHHHLSQSDHKVSTVAWVMDDAPTRR